MTRQTEIKTARFWIHWNGAWVRLALRDGESTALQHIEDHDEGWCAEYQIYERLGDVIFCQIATDSRDCDGPFSSNLELVCAVDNLTNGGQGIRQRSPLEQHRCGLESWECNEKHGPQRPDWHEEDYYQRDTCAEAMNY